VQLDANWQLTWVPSAFASIILTIFRLDAFPATTIPLYPALELTLSYARLHTSWLGCISCTMMIMTVVIVIDDT